MEQVRDQKRLEQIVQGAGNTLVLVFFMDKKCPHCSRANPKIEKMALEYSLIIILKIDLRESPAFTYDFNISAVPEFVFIKGGSVVDRIKGADTPGVERRIRELSG
ncbi:thioredoxin-T-like [Mantella aurantiaca]